MLYLFLLFLDGFLVLVSQQDERFLWYLQLLNPLCFLLQLLLQVFEVLVVDQFIQVLYLIGIFLLLLLPNFLIPRILCLNLLSCIICLPDFLISFLELLICSRINFLHKILVKLTFLNSVLLSHLSVCRQIHKSLQILRQIYEKVLKIVFYLCKTLQHIHDIEWQLVWRSFSMLLSVQLIFTDNQG